MSTSGAGKAKSKLDDAKRTLIVDDSRGLIDFVSEHVSRHPAVKALTSAREAIDVLHNETFERVVADMTFEHEALNGLEVLDAAHSASPHAELFLLTGWPITPETRQKVTALGGVIVGKATAPTDFMNDLLLGASVTVDAGEPASQDVDIAALRIRYEQLERHAADVSRLNDLFIDEIITELSGVPNQSDPIIQVGAARLTASQLKEEVRSRTPIGLELVSLHCALITRLRRGGRPAVPAQAGRRVP